MSSPLPPDPYEALGVAKDADIATVRTAHRKLALKHHPDRIKDEAERERGKNEFQKIQQAYEILTDPTRRARYDDRVKLAELRKERMMRQASYAPSSPMPSRTGHYRDRSDEEVIYETVGRVPQPQGATYFDRDHYDDHVPATTARKADQYDKKSTPPKSDKRREMPPRFYGPMEGVSFKISGQMKAKAAEARARTKENHKNAETRDREKRRDRSEKQSSRYAHVDEDSDSEVETIPQNYFTKSRQEPRHRYTEPETETIKTRIPPPSRRPPTYDDEDSHDEGMKWERHHQSSRDYIAESQQRPGVPRSGSDAYVYWAGDTKSGRRSGSDNEARTAGPPPRRTTAEEARPRPSMPVHSSAPSNLRSSMAQEQSRSKTSSYPTERESRRGDPPPSFGRSQTMPVRSKKDGNAPSRGSALKNETQPDSGYYSSSNPNTPEMRGDSPPQDTRESSRRSSRRAPTSVRYTIVDPAHSDEERHPRINRTNTRVLNQDEDRSRMYHSPERGSVRDNDHDSDRERPQRERPRLRKLDTDTARMRSSRDVPSMSRHDSGRYDSQSIREGLSASRKLFGEVLDNSPSSYSRPPPSSVRTSSYQRAKYSDHHSASPTEYADQKFRHSPNYPTTSRRSSTANAV